MPDLVTPYLVLAATDVVDVVVFWRSSIIKLLVSFDTSSIFNAVFDGVVLLPIDARLVILLLLFSLYLSRTDVGMIIDDDDGFSVSSYDVGTVNASER